MANTATLKPAKPQIPHPAAAVDPGCAPACDFAMLSHRGHVRHVNQDACAALPERGAFVVCDGIGGAAAGEVASHLAAEAFLHSLSQPLPRQPRRTPAKAVAGPASPAEPAGRNNGAGHFPANHPHARLHEAVHAANQAVLRHSRKSPSLHGMGTTLVAALFDETVPEDAPANPTLWLAHVGDSRCYRLRRGVLELLTEDHSLVEEQVRAGVLSRIQARRSPIRNIITRAIGAQPAVEPDIASHATRPGDLYLLASDGLTRELTDAEIALILSQVPIQPHADTLESACHTLIDAANAHGGRDNITVVLIACT
jgi:protein phosphatase